MNSRLSVFFLVSACTFSILSAADRSAGDPQGEGKEHLCSRANPCAGDEALMPTPRGSVDDWDVRHYWLDVELTLEYVDDALDQVKIAGTNTITAAAVVDSLTEVTLDFRSNMNISAITGNVSGFTRLDHDVTVSLDRAYASGETFDIVVAYDGYPDEGGYGAFSFWERNGNPVVATLSEPFYAQYWWPCKDVLGDKATVDTHITVPDTMVAVSNGVLEGTDVLSESRLKFRWSTDYPMAVYLTSLAVTNYETYPRTYEYDDGNGTQTMPVYCYLYPDHWNSTSEIPLPSWKAGCDETLAILEDLSSLYGQYPFVLEKYGLAETGGAGGLGASMEHQTVSSMYQINSYSDIVAHETAHQWWGDNVTCGTWYDIWLNEGFASYSESLYREVKVSGGIDSYWERMIDRRPGDSDGQVYRTNINNVNNIFSGNDVYDKGAWVLHMLRHVVGDQAFFDGLIAYRDAYQDGFATTDDFESTMSDIFGHDLGFFFDQWVMSPGSPDYNWNFETRLINGRNYLVLSVDQGQDSNSFGLITMPIDIRVTTDQGVETHTIWNDDWTEYYVVGVAGTVSEVHFDEDGGVEERNWVLDDHRKFLPGDMTAPPVVVEFTPLVFGASQPGTTQLDIYFSEDIESLASEAVVLIGQNSGSQVPQSVSYDPLGQHATVTYSSLPDDLYTFTILSSQVSANGLAMDGEVSDADWWDEQLLPSGNGQPGGDAGFALERKQFDTDADGDIDLLDFAGFSACVNGPQGVYNPACDSSDADADGDVDWVDFAQLQIHFGT